MFFKSQPAVMENPKEDLVAYLSKKTKPLFEKELSIPPYPPDMQRRLDAYKEADLTDQAKTLIFQYRCNEIEKLGFQKVDPKKLAEKFGGTGEWRSSNNAVRYEWFYDHVNGTTLSASTYNWAADNRPWFTPTTFHDNKAKSFLGCLDYLKSPMPYGVVLKMQELKKANLFNAFNVLAPIECWRETIHTDPILLGVVHELVSNNKVNPQQQFFFIAEWE